MKIFITCEHLNNVGGVQRWVETMGKYLSKEHEITFVVKNKEGIGEFAGGLMLYGRVATEQEIQDEKQIYDFGIFNHFSFYALEHLTINSLGVSHGVIEAEKPVIDFRRNRYCKVYKKYIATSQFVKEYWEERFDMPIFDDVVLNPITIPEKIDKPNPKLHKVLYISPYQELPMIKKACNKLGLEYKFANKEIDTESLYKWADLVIAVGRSVYEAMSYGKPVIVFDQRAHICRLPLADGYVNLGYPINAIEHNCTGLYAKEFWSQEDLEFELSQYHAGFGEDNYNLIKQYQSVETITNKIWKIMQF